MDKICTRCNFRNPATRGVCQVCGYKKFVAAADVQVAVVNQPVTVVINAEALVEQFTTALKRTYATIQSACAKPEVQLTVKSVDSTPVRTAPVYMPQAHNSITFNDGEDLDSMIAWFKSYGVDQPLILDQDPQPERNKAA